MGSTLGGQGLTSAGIGGDEARCNGQRQQGVHADRAADRRRDQRIIAAIAVLGLLRAGMSGNEASAIGSLRAINSAQSI